MLERGRLHLSRCAPESQLLQLLELLEGLRQAAQLVVIQLGKRSSVNLDSLPGGKGLESGTSD